MDSDVIVDKTFQRVEKKQEPVSKDIQYPYTKSKNVARLPATVILHKLSSSPLLNDTRHYNLNISSSFSPRFGFGDVGYLLAIYHTLEAALQTVSGVL